MPTPNTSITSVSVKREGRDEIVHLDAGKDTFASDLTEVIRLKQAESAAPLTTRITALEAENATFRDMLVGEIVRLKRVEGETEVKAETDYLCSLPVERLQMEWSRANKGAAPPVPVTTPDAPESPNGEWGVVKAD